MIPNGSVITGNVRSTPWALGAGEPCHGIGAKFPISLVFGADYIGDLGPNAPICIVHSKLTFTQFQGGGVLLDPVWNAPAKPILQDKVQMQIDDAIVKKLSTPAPGASPRCANFTQLP